MNDNTEALPPLPFLPFRTIDNQQWVRIQEAREYAREYARATLAQRQQVPTTAWLVEWRFNGVQWLYLWPSAPGGFSFTSDASKALRFARREDAEAALQWARDTDAARRPIGSLTRQGLALGEMLVTEHAWPALTATPSAQRQQMPDKPILDRESTWWALAMGAAASLEDAANCLRDPDAKKAARGAALHVRRQCAALTAAPSAQAEPVAFYKQSDAEPPPRTPRLQGPNG